MEVEGNEDSQGDEEMEDVGGTGVKGELPPLGQQARILAGILQGLSNSYRVLVPETVGSPERLGQEVSETVILKCFEGNSDRQGEAIESLRGALINDEASGRVINKIQLELQALQEKMRGQAQKELRVRLAQEQLNGA